MTEGADPNAETLAALERLVHRHKAITPDQARAAARLITGNPDFEFPAQKLDQKRVEGQGTAAAPSPEAPTDNASPAGSESL